MRAMARSMGLVVLLAALPGVSGCYSCAVSLAKCTAKYKACESVAHDFEPGGTLRVRNDFGPIMASGDEVPECRITGRVYVHAPTKQEARDIGEQVHVVAEPNEGALLVTVKRPPLEEDRHVWVDLEIAIPSQAHVDCETKFGRIKLVAVEGDIRAITQFGAVTCDKIVSRNITAKSEFGAVYVTCGDACPADLVADVRTEFGKIRFHAPEAFRGDFDIKTDFGSTRARIPVASYDEWTDDRKVATTGAGDGKLSLRTEFGSIRLR